LTGRAVEPRAPRAPQPAWQRNLPVLVASQLITVAAMSIVLPFIPFFVRELGITDRAAVERWSGLIFSGPFLAAGLMSPVWGYLGDRYGHKPMVVRALAGLAVVNLLLYFVRTPLQFWVLRLVQGMVTGFIPAALAITSASTPPGKLPGAMGKLSASSSAGRLIGPALGGVLAGFLPFRQIFLLVGATISLALVIVVTRLHAPPLARRRRENTFAANFRFAAMDPHMRAGIIALFVTMAAVSMVMPIFPLFVEDLLGGADAEFWTGIAFAMVAGFTMIGASLIGRASERMGLKTLLLGGLATAAAALALHPFVRGIAGLLAVRALLGVGLAGIQPVLISMVSRRAPEGRGGGIVGFASSATIFGFFAGPFTGGWIASHVGTAGVFLLAAAIMVVSALVVWATAPRLGRDREVVRIPEELPR
jgi:MFS transporter, DHA1 family, multidrug resistance protein